MKFNRESDSHAKPVATSLQPVKKTGTQVQLQPVQSGPVLVFFLVLQLDVTDVFQVGSGDVEQDRRVSEAGQDVDKDLASTSKLHPHCTQCPYLESWVRQREEAETEVDIQTEVTDRHK